MPVSAERAQEPLALRRPPRTPGAAEAAFHDFAARAFELVRAGQAERLWLTDLELHELLEPSAASRASQLHAVGSLNLRDASERATRVLAGATFRAACAQSVYEEPAGGRLGLREPAWVMERVLLVGVDPSFGPAAGWLEGRFVFTSRGFVAIDLGRLEPPRPQHSDLELASCEISTGWETHNRLGLSRREIH